jgi:hypothetical protein
LKHRAPRHIAAGVVAAATAALLAGLALAMPSRSLGTSITSLRVTGSSSHPVFTISGSGLSVPPKSPKTSPSNQKLCPIVINGNAGFDYGTRFSLIVWNAQVNSANAQRYAGGRYRPALNELDCIGLIVLKATPRQIRFTLGAAYLQLYRTNPGLILNGDVVEVILNSARFATVVRF